MKGIGIFGTKLGNTQVYDDQGRLIPVTVIRFLTCYVTDHRTPERDGYAALQVGYRETVEKHLNKPEQGHLKKNNIPLLRSLREFRIAAADLEKFPVGTKISTEMFDPPSFVDVTATSIGKGFQGGVRRHGFRGGAETHGSMQHRAPGSIGGTTRLHRVMKGKRMAGHMGNTTVTVQNLRIVKTIPEKSLLLLKGAVPGSRGTTVLVRKAMKKSGRNA